jgi:signal transduction histidine kinase
VLAYEYPLLNIFWSMLIFFGFFLWIWLLVVVFTDIFRSPDLSGGGKAAWFIFVLVVPLIGVLIYLLVRGHKMEEHAAQAAKRQDEEMRAYVKQAAGNGSGSTSEELAKLADLRDRGVLSEQEFNAQKAKILT